MPIIAITPKAVMTKGHYQKAPKGFSLIKKKVKIRDKNLCQRCLDKKPGATAHHIKPRDKGGTDDLDNLIWLCSDCHDFIEIQEPPLINKAQIQGSYEEKWVTVVPVVKEEKEKENLSKSYIIVGYGGNERLMTKEDYFKEHPVPHRSRVRKG